VGTQQGTGIGPRLTATVRVHLVLSLTGVCRELVREGSHTRLAAGSGRGLTATVRGHLVLSLTGVCRELVREGSHTRLAALRLPLRVGLLGIVAASLGVAVAGGRVPEGPLTVRRAVVALGSCRSPPLESYFRPSCPILPSPRFSCCVRDITL
jgi:hypothetical protein